MISTCLVIGSASRVIETIPNRVNCEVVIFLEICTSAQKGCNKYNSVASKCIMLARSQLTLPRSPITARRNSALIEEHISWINYLSPFPSQKYFLNLPDIFFPGSFVKYIPLKYCQKDSSTSCFLCAFRTSKNNSCDVIKISFQIKSFRLKSFLLC